MITLNKVKNEATKPYDRLLTEEILINLEKVELIQPYELGKTCHVTHKGKKHKCCQVIFATHNIIVSESIEEIIRKRDRFEGNRYKTKEI